MQTAGTCRTPSGYVRIPPAAPGQETPEPISEDEFDAVLDRDAFTRDRYEHWQLGLQVSSIDALRVLCRRGQPGRKSCPSETRSTVNAVQGELEPIQRLLRNVEGGLDDPKLLADAAAWLRAAASQLDGVAR